MHLLMSENYFIVGDEVMKNAGESMVSPAKDYVPPKVLKMRDMAIGEGDCTSSGSGPGSTEDCEEFGGTAGKTCEDYGSVAGGTCDSVGSSASKYVK
jgi:hypothetical protein